MSTRGLIAIEDADRKCRSIFVHFDMYIDGAGETLIKYYKTIKRVEKLLSLGDISSLGGATVQYRQQVRCEGNLHGLSQRLW